MNLELLEKTMIDGIKIGMDELFNVLFSTMKFKKQNNQPEQISNEELIGLYNTYKENEGELK